MQTPVSFQHKSNIVCAVLYELQVLLVTPRLPHLANDSVISLGSSKTCRNLVVQPPAVPYFVEPGIAFGLKPVIIKEITVLLYSLCTLNLCY